MNTTLEDLIAKHKAATTERERAEIERDLWDNHTDATIRAGTDRERWLAKTIGEKGNRTGLRQTLLNAGPDIDEIWLRITRDGMPLPTAWGRLKAAESYASESKLPLTEGVKIALAEYDGWPAARTKSGQMYRKRAPYSLADKPQRRLRRSKPINPDVERKFWVEIKHKINTFMSERLADVDHMTANNIQRDFGIRLQSLCDEFSTKINFARGRARKDAAIDITSIRLSQVRDACGILAVDPPGRDQPADLIKANRNKKNLATKYHPDANPGEHTEAMAAKYNEIIEAYATLELYNEQLERVSTNG